MSSGRNLVATPAPMYLFHDPEDVYNAPRADRPPPSIWRQLLIDVAIVLGVFAGIVILIVLSDLS